MPRHFQYLLSFTCVAIAACLTLSAWNTLHGDPAEAQSKTALDEPGKSPASSDREWCLVLFEYLPDATARLALPSGAVVDLPQPLMQKVRASANQPVFDPDSGGIPALYGIPPMLVMLLNPHLETGGAEKPVTVVQGPFHVALDPEGHKLLLLSASMHILYEMHTKQSRGDLVASEVGMPSNLVPHRNRLADYSDVLLTAPIVFGSFSIVPVAGVEDERFAPMFTNYLDNRYAVIANDDFHLLCSFVREGESRLFRATSDVLK